VLGQFQGNTRLTLYLSQDVSEARGVEVSNDLLTDDAIESAVYVSSAQALEDFSRAAGFADILAELEANPLPASIIITPVVLDVQSVEALASRLQGLAEAELVQRDSLWLQRLQAISALLAAIARILGFVVVIGLCFIVGNTIKLAIENRKDEIRVIKLVGGTYSFIARPFLYSGLLFGMSGGLLAGLLQEFVVLGFSGPLQELMQLYESSFQLSGLGIITALKLIGFGGIIGWFAALLASVRHIAAISP
jgi:cell division transport system permease protein